MGTSNCALFFFKAQDIVPEGTEDTPVKPPCQMIVIAVIYHYLILFSFVFNSLYKYRQ
jgi:hypothetical protein